MGLGALLGVEMVVFPWVVWPMRMLLGCLANTWAAASAADAVPLLISIINRLMGRVG